MSQQGIFSIAPDSQGGSPASSNGANGSGNGSPFTAVSNEPAQSSPFTAVGESSPFQQAGRSQPTEQGRGGIPERRPEGQPPALGGGSVEAESAEATTPQAEEASPFVAVRDNTQQPGTAGGPFQMNGFPQQNGNQVMEAAPIARTQEASPFTAVQDDRSDYERAKANLEPQQDFAAVPPQHQAASPQPVQAQYAPQPEPTPASNQPPQATSPTLTPVASSALAGAGTSPNPTSAVAPAFQQLELRAIFGVDHTLDQNEILQRARTLPGIRNVAVVGNQEAAALSNFRQAMQAMGFGDSNEMKLNSGGGSVDFLTEGDTTIAVLLEGSYAPGVQETLIIVAREIGKLA